MGLLDSLVSGAMKGALQQLDGSALPSLLAQLLGRTDLGGFGGLIETLRRGGLDREVGSWLGQGSNMPVSPDQLRRAMPDQDLSRMAQEAGLPLDQLLEILARHLPQTIDGLSPNGHLRDDPMQVDPQAGGSDDASGGGSLSDQAGLDDLDRLR
ncbi:YidB family protein [Rhodoplanes roseus]|nr:YidB family protein [Rhodoplanes roseus]